MTAALNLSLITHRHPGAERPTLRRDLEVDDGEMVAVSAVWVRQDQPCSGSRRLERRSPATYCRRGECSSACHRTGVT